MLLQVGVYGNKSSLALEVKVLDCCADWMRVLQIWPVKCWQQSAFRSTIRGQCLLGSVGGGWHMAGGAYRLLPHQCLPLLGRRFSLFQKCRSERIQFQDGFSSFTPLDKMDSDDIIPVVSQVF